jgi:peptidyl-prolyl cis-trans isomerase D
MRIRSSLVVAALTLGACAGDARKPSPMANPPTPSPAPYSSSADHISVDHILIAVKNSRMPAVRRTEAEARKIAEDLLAKLRAGGDWAAAKRTNSEDPPPGGPYGMSNRGVRPVGGEIPRDSMVPAFGDVGFSLAVGEMGLASYDARTSPFGFHIIKRVK